MSLCTSCHPTVLASQVQAWITGESQFSRPMLPMLSNYVSHTQHCMCCIKRCALCFVYSTFRYKTICYLKPPFCERTLPARLTPHPVPRSLLFFWGGGGNHRFFYLPPPYNSSFSLALVRMGSQTTIYNMF